MKFSAPVSHEAETLKLFRCDPECARAYLNEAVKVAFEEDDPELALIALATVAKARGMTRVARDAELARESLHRMLSKKGNPRWRSLFRVLKALDLRISVETA